MKVLVNATTITVGGGVQAALSFIEFAAGQPKQRASFLFAVSAPLLEALPAQLRQDPRVRAFARSPAHPLKGRASRAAVARLAREYAPDLVYSLGFPSYVAFDAPEVGRYTNGWDIFDFSVAKSVMPLPARVTRALRTRYRLSWARHAAFYETQTEVAKAAIVDKLRVAPERVLVVPNSVNPRFLDGGRTGPAVREAQRVPMIFCLSAAFRYKNLEIIPAVAATLAALGRVATFVVTLPPDSAIWRSIRNEARRRSVEEHVRNAGPLTLDACVEHYRRADCLFLPTLAEMFSATYLEAMAMGVPIVTTDLDFARDTCQDAALYYDPLSAQAAAQALDVVLTDKTRKNCLVGAGARRLATFPGPAAKHRLLLDWLLALRPAPA